MAEQTATIEAPPAPDTRSKPKTDPRPKVQPPYAVILFNDDDHTMLYVIESLQKVFGYAVEKCLDLAMQAHAQGKAIVWTGMLEVAELKRDQLRSRGPDVYASRPVNYPLKVEVEALEG